MYKIKKSALLLLTMALMQFSSAIPFRVAAELVAFACVGSATNSAALSYKKISEPVKQDLCYYSKYGCDHHMSRFTSTTQLPFSYEEISKTVKSQEM